MTCKDCIHRELCADYVSSLAKVQNADVKYISQWLDEIEGKRNQTDNECEHFADRSRFVELPVKISDKYYMDIKQAKTVSNMLLTISQNFEYNGDNSSAFKSYFIGVGDAIESCLKVLTPFWKEKK